MKGIITAIVTPFCSDNSIDLPAFERLVANQIRFGVNGIVVAGSTGESMTLTEAEKCLLVKSCLKEANGKIAVIGGASSSVTQQACDNQKQMAEMGVSATLHTTPWYNKPTQEGLYRHFRAICDAAAVPTIIYNIPGRTCVNLELDTLFRLLKDCPTIVGIKECNLELSRLQTLLTRSQEIRPGFSVLSGEDNFVLPLLAMGGHGVISATSNFAAKQFVAMYDHFCAGHLAKAQATAGQINPLVSLAFFRSNPIPAKTILSLTGRIEPNFRLPLCPLTQTEFSELKNKAMPISQLFDEPINC